MAGHDKYELAFIRSGRILRFRSNSLTEIKDINQILIDINFDYKTLKDVREYRVNNRFYILRVKRGIIEIKNEYNRGKNIYQMADKFDFKLDNMDKLDSKLIFEDSDEYFKRDHNNDVRLSENRLHKRNVSLNNRKAKNHARNYNNDFDLESKEGPVFYSKGVDVDKNEDSDLDYYLSSPDYTEESDEWDYYDSSRELDLSVDANEEVGDDLIEDYDLFDDNPVIDNEVIKLSSYVNASSHRKLVLEDINYSLKTPKNISSDTGLRPNFVSKVLRDFKNQNIVVCINEEVRKGKLYRLTNLGIKIYDYLQIK